MTMMMTILFKVVLYSVLFLLYLFACALCGTFTTMLGYVLDWQPEPNFIFGVLVGGYIIWLILGSQSWKVKCLATVANMFGMIAWILGAAVAPGLFVLFFGSPQFG